MISMISDAKMQLALYSFLGGRKIIFFPNIYSEVKNNRFIHSNNVFFSFISITGGFPHIPRDLNPWGLSVTQGQDILFSSFNSGAGRCCGMVQL